MATKTKAAVYAEDLRKAETEIDASYQNAVLAVAEAIAAAADAQIEAEEAAEAVEDIEAAWSSGNVEPTADAYTRAVANAKRSALLAAGYVARSKRMPNTTTNRHVADAVADAARAYFGAEVNVVSTYAEVPTPTEPVLPMMVIRQTSRTEAKESGIQGGRIEVSYYRRAIHAPLDLDAIAAKGRDIDRVYIYPMGGSGNTLNSDTHTAKVEGMTGVVVDHSRFGVGGDGAPGGAVPVDPSFGEMTEDVVRSGLYSVTRHLWDSQRSYIKAGWFSEAGIETYGPKVLQDEVAADGTRTVTIRALLAMSGDGLPPGERAGAAFNTSRHSAPHLTYLLNEMRSPVGTFAHGIGTVTSFEHESEAKKLPTGELAADLMRSTVTLTATSKAA